MIIDLTLDDEENHVSSDGAAAKLDVTEFPSSDASDEDALFFWNKGTQYDETEEEDDDGRHDEDLPSLSEDLEPIIAAVEAQTKRFATDLITLGTRPRVDFAHNFLMGAVQGDNVLNTQDVYEITYTSKLSTLREWRAHLPAACVLGFDTEGEGAMLQLCCLSTSKILVYLMPKDTTEAASAFSVLGEMLESSQYEKVGIGASNDAIILAQQFKLEPKNIFDLTWLSEDLEIDTEGKTRRSFNADKSRGVIVINEEPSQRPANRGLKSLFRDLFAAEFHPLQEIGCETSKYVQPELPAKGHLKWTTYPLRLAELEYAAKDALFGSLLYNAMITKFSEEELRVLKAKAIKSFATQLARRRHDKVKRESDRQQQAKRRQAKTEKRKSNHSQNAIMSSNKKRRLDTAQVGNARTKKKRKSNSSQFSHAQSGLRSEKRQKQTQKQASRAKQKSIVKHETVFTQSVPRPQKVGRMLDRPALKNEANVSIRLEP